MRVDVDILARTIYGEARGEYGRLDGGLASLIAIGNVVLNRLKQHTHYGQTVSEVCLKPWQFSCWNPTDPNHKVLIQTQSGRLFDLCLEVAEKLIDGEWPDLTKGCDHYHASTLTKFPTWTLKAKPKFRVGQHIFYDLKK